MLIELYQVFRIGLCGLPEAVMTTEKCSSTIEHDDFVSDILDATSCYQWASPVPIQIQINTSAGGNIVATVMFFIKYIFDISSGSAVYNPVAGTLTIAVKQNETLGSISTTDLSVLAFCVQATNPFQTATGAQLQVSATLGSSNVPIQAAVAPGPQVSQTSGLCLYRLITLPILKISNITEFTQALC